MYQQDQSPGAIVKINIPVPALRDSDSEDRGRAQELVFLISSPGILSGREASESLG